MKNFQYIFVSILILFLSCETVVDINIPVEPPLLVINSSLGDGEFIKVNVSQSQHILDSHDYKKVVGATVEIYENNQLLTTLPDSADGNYISATFKPIRGKMYGVKVSKTGFETVNAEVLLPLDTAEILQVKLDTVEVNEFDYSYETIRFSVDINDNGANKNFYEIAIYMEYYNYMYDYDVVPPVVLDSFQVIERLYIQSLDPSLEGYQSYGQSIIFNDELFNGHKYTMRVLSNSFFYFGGDDYKFEPTLYVVLNNTSESYYLYGLSSQLQNWTTGDPFAQPVTVYNNIENGFGILGAYNTSVVKVE